MSLTVEQRFFEKVTFDHGCWSWKAKARTNGYGVFNTGSRTKLAHRFAYEVMVRPLSKEETLDHLCRNTLCCNPLHLEPVSLAENTRRGIGGIRQRRKTHCPKGHEYTAENTRIKQPGDRRECRQCGRDYENAKLRARGADIHNKFKTHCKRGHAFDEANTIVLRGRHRACRICSQDTKRAYEARKRAP